jgi:hypothetical protein
MCDMCVCVCDFSLTEKVARLMKKGAKYFCSLLEEIKKIALWRMQVIHC